jgi:uncharacterized NAD(P)/FAD-binding protein YdhS
VRGYPDATPVDILIALREHGDAYKITALSRPGFEWIREHFDIDLNERDLFIFPRSINKMLCAISEAGLLVEHVRTPMQ